MIEFLNKYIDKLVHFLGGYFIASIIGGFAGFLVAVGIGTLKEIYDLANSGVHTPDIKDWIATLIGAALGWLNLFVHGL